jgi:hypothetical protein
MENRTTDIKQMQIMKHAPSLPGNNTTMKANQYQYYISTD